MGRLNVFGRVDRCLHAPERLRTKSTYFRHNVQEVGAIPSGTATRKLLENPYLCEHHALKLFLCGRDLIAWLYISSVTCPSELNCADTESIP